MYAFTQQLDIPILFEKGLMELFFELYDLVPTIRSYSQLSCDYEQQKVAKSIGV